MISNLVPRKKYYAIYPIHLLPGKIESVEGLSKLQENDSIVTILTTKNIGDVIQDTGSFGQAYALIHIVFNNRQELIDIIDEVHSILKIYDNCNQNMVNRMLDVNQIQI